MNKKSIDFFVLGVQKSGTTTLHNWLIQNPQICLPKIKETHYFSSNHSKGIKWYLSQFNDDNRKIKGEVDPSYIYCKDSAMNIKRYIDKPKFIIIFRKPIDRAYSHYLMSKYRGYESDTFINAIRKASETPATSPPGIASENTNPLKTLSINNSMANTPPI